MASNELNLCACCARRGKTCCQDREIYLSPGDVARIIAHAGGEPFYEWALPRDPAYLAQDDDPVWQRHVFRRDGRRRTLRRKASGDCWFLGDAGCRLSMEIRPLVCRLHPFAYTADGIAAETEKGCPENLLPPGANLISALAMSGDAAARWHHMLYDEVIQDEPDRGTDLRPAC